MSTFKDILENHQTLARRRKDAEARLQQVRDKFGEIGGYFEEKEITVYLAGSLGRGDFGKKSDLDLFFISDKTGSKPSNLDNLRAVAHAITINESLGYPSFSNDGKYLKVCELSRMLETLGSPQDDNENWFTVRMLLLLESQWVCNKNLYETVARKIIDQYFRDSRGKQSFRPLFLLNDILRYWRTLCLNYELARNDPDKPWYKKNINLKFSRMITIFGTVLAIITKPNCDAEYIAGLARLSPHLRFVRGLEILSDTQDLEDGYANFLDDYEYFLQCKENPEITDPKDKQVLVEKADHFSEYIYKALTHKEIDPRLMRFLVL